MSEGQRRDYYFLALCVASLFLSFPIIARAPRRPTLRYIPRSPFVRCLTHIHTVHPPEEKGERAAEKASSYARASRMYTAHS